MKKRILSKKRLSKLKRKSPVVAKATKGYSLIKVSHDFKHELEILSEDKKIAPLMVLNKALVLYKQAEEQAEGKKLSFYQRNKDIIERGQFHGSKTLASDKKYLEGFGR